MADALTYISAVNPETDGALDDRQTIRAERALAAPYWGGFQPRILITFLVSSAIWIAVVVLGTIGIIPLWLGLIINTVVASTFYMPMHEAVHGNIAGKRASLRWIDEAVGMACSIPLGFSFSAHRTAHTRHHAYTNNPRRDPDHYTDGPLRALPGKWLALTVTTTLLPLFALVHPARRLLPSGVRRSMSVGSFKRSGLAQLFFWGITTAILVVAFLLGHGWAALLLWYVPARLQMLWLLFIFAWLPHHPANQVGRYVDTRVAVFPGSGLLARGHDHHAVHHLFPRVPHLRLRRLWADCADEMVAKGVRSEGGAKAATGPIIWR